MPHLVYSDKEIESCLHFILLNRPKDDPNQSQQHKHQDQQQQYCWWPCLVLEHMNMLHGVCQQKRYMQTTAAEAERRAAFVEQCRVQLSGATSRPVVLLLGPSPPKSATRFMFYHDNKHDDNTNNHINDTSQPGWELQPMVGRASLNEWCASLEHQQQQRHRLQQQPGEHADDSCVELENFLQALTEVKTFIAPSDPWLDAGASLGVGLEDMTQNERDAVFLHISGEEDHRTVAVVEP